RGLIICDPRGTVPRPGGETGMPEFLPLREEDPARVGPYRLIGRLGEEVYLAEGVEDGPPVVVKLLRPGIDRERFLRLVASIREVSAFCSAQVLAAVTAAGTRLKDAALHRLAVGTATALVAIHQAGAVHGDVRPENMVLGPDGPRPESEPEQQPVRRGPLIAVAAFAAGAMLSGVAVYALAPPRTGAVLAGSASPAVVISSAPPVTPSVTTAPVAGVPPEASDDVELPDIGTTLHEHPQDRVRLTAYLQAKAPFKAFVRDASGRFEEVGQTEEPRVSPDGRWVALNPWVKFQNSEMDHVRVRDLSTGESFTVQTVRKPDTTMVPVWSPDGRRLLLSIKKGDAVTGRGRGRLVLAGLDGETVRVLAEGPADRLEDVSVWFTRR